MTRCFSASRWLQDANGPYEADATQLGYSQPASTQNELKQITDTATAKETREAGAAQYSVPSTGRRRRARQRRCRSNTDAQSDGLVLPEREAKAARAIPDVPDLKEAVSRHLSTADRADRLDIRVAVTRKYITADSQEKTPVAVQLLQNLDHRNCRRTGPK